MTAYEKLSSKKYVILSIIVFVIVLTGTFLTAAYVNDQIYRNISTEFKKEADDTIDIVKYTMALHINALRAIRSYVIQSNTLSSHDWSSYIKSYSSSISDCPCARAYVYIERVLNEQKTAFIQSVKDDNSIPLPVLRNFKIYPEADKKEYFVVRHIYPIERNETAFGFDISSEQTRKKAIEKARDTGETVMTKTLTLITGPQGFFVILPVYTTAETPKTIEGRREALRGFIYGVYYTENFLADTLKKNQNFFSISQTEIFDKIDGESMQDTLLFDNAEEDLKAMSLLSRSDPTIWNMLTPYSRHLKSLSHTQDITIVDRVWSFFFVAPASVWMGDILHKRGVWITLILGIILSFLFGSLFFNFYLSQRDLLKRLRVLTADIKKSEEQYRTMVERSPFAIAIHSEGKVVLANEAAILLLGATSAKEIIGKKILDIVHPDYHAVVTQRVEKQYREHEPAPPLEEKFIKQDGSIIDVLVAGSFITYNGKRGAQVVIQDITEKKKIEKELKERVTQLENLNRVFVGRELRMAELKKELEQLKKESKGKLV